MANHKKQDMKTPASARPTSELRLPLGPHTFLAVAISSCPLCGRKFDPEGPAGVQVMEEEDGTEAMAVCLCSRCVAAIRHGSEAGVVEIRDKLDQILNRVRETLAAGGGECQR
jgi:hypothetical protein